MYACIGLLQLESAETSAKETEEKRAELAQELENLADEASLTQKSSDAQSNKTAKALDTSKKNHEKAKKQIADLKVLEPSVPLS